MVVAIFHFVPACKFFNITYIEKTFFPCKIVHFSVVLSIWYVHGLEWGHVCKPLQGVQTLELDNKIPQYTRLLDIILPLFKNLSSKMCINLYYVLTLIPFVGHYTFLIKRSLANYVPNHTGPWSPTTLNVDSLCVQRIPDNSKAYL